jgi:glycerol-1-phosphatase
VRYDRLLLDLDGTVYVGRDVVSGAREAIAAVRAGGAKVAFVTNDPVSSRSAYVTRLGRFGITVAEDELVTCAWAAAQLVAEEHPAAAVLALGSAAWRSEHEAAGLRLVEDWRDASVVSLGGDPSFGYRELTAAVRAVIGGAAFYGSNRDATFPDTDGPAPAAGAMIAAVEYATGRQARCAGKPEPGMFREARRLLGDGSYLLVGDRLDADVAGGAGAGIPTVLVLTGTATRADLRVWHGPAPAHVVESISQLPLIVSAADR